MAVLSVPASGNELARRSAEIEARRVALERESEVATAAARAEELRILRISRDSVLLSVRARKISRMSDVDIRQALSVITALVGDTTGRAWRVSATRELERRASVGRRRMAAKKAKAFR
jgi:hypothetical protein